MIYLDYNATTPCDPEVLDAMLPYFSQKFGNAASGTHSYGWVAADAVNRARKSIADLIHAEEQEMVFTSGSTEACNLAIKGVWERYQTKGNHIITCVTEHKAVLDTCQYLEQKGASITYLPVDGQGLIDISVLDAAITPETILIAIMYANNETGVIQPVRDIGAIARKHKVLFFSDATQAVGKIPVNVQDDTIDILALSAHKIYGPKGVGALYLRRRQPRVSLGPQMHGGAHERGLRSGTINVPGVVGLGKACAMAQKLMPAEAIRLAGMRDALENQLVQEVQAIVNGADGPRLPHVSNVSFPGVKSERLIAKLNADIAFSVGSACTTALRQPSHVLQGMGLTPERMEGSVRLSLGRPSSMEEVEAAASLLKKAISEYLIKF
jgi:cysteine desulfurase